VSKLHHAVLDNFIKELPKTAMPVEHAHFQPSQPKIEMDAIDHKQTADVLRDILKIDSHALTAEQDKSKTLSQLHNVSKLHYAILDNYTMDLPKTAIDAELANFHKFQTKTDKDAIDQKQTVDVLRDSLKINSHAKVAHQIKFNLEHKILYVSQLHYVLVKTNITELPKTAMLVELANFHKSQLMTEVDAIDQDQDAHVLNSTPQMDLHAFLANQVMLPT